jgi:hypothetical protein
MVNSKDEAVLGEMVGHELHFCGSRLGERDVKVLGLARHLHPMSHFVDYLSGLLRFKRGGGFKLIPSSGMLKYLPCLPDSCAMLSLVQ